MRNNLDKEIDKELRGFIPKIKCKICEKEVRRNPHATNQYYCNPCKKKARRFRAEGYRKQINLKILYDKGNKLIKIIKCKNCNKKVYGYETSNRRFCKQFCQYEFNKGRKSVNRQEIYIKCKTCDSQIKTVKSELKLGKKFCSRLCYEVDRKKNWTFPHKGKPIGEWMFNGDQLKLKTYREKLKKRMKKFFKEHPEVYEKRRGKTLTQIYGEEVARRIKEAMKKSANKTWKEKREYMLNTPNRFKKGQKPWNAGLKMKKGYGYKTSQIKEKKFLEEIGINV